MATNPRPKDSRSSVGTPSSSQITVNGSGKAEFGHQVGGSLRIQVGQPVQEFVHDGLHSRPEPLDSARRERRRHQTAQTSVIRRIHREHVPSELWSREALSHYPSAQGQGGVHVLGEPEVIERLTGLRVAHDQPGIVTVGQRDLVHGAQLSDLGEEWVGVVPIGAAPRLERYFDSSAPAIDIGNRTRRIGCVIHHGRTPSTESAATRSCRSRS